MKLFDFDGMFDDKLGEYMEKHEGEYTEKQWEDLIPRLYKNFGDTLVKSAGNTPKGYYAAMSDKELCDTLVAHIEEDVPVSDFLCRELEKRNCPDELLALLSSMREEVVTMAINIIGGNEKAFSAYLDLVADPCVEEDMKDNIVDQIKQNADPVLEKALELYGKGVEREYMMEILSRCKRRDDRIYEILIGGLKGADNNIPMRASYVAAYGDARALPVLLEMIDREEINYLEYQELKYAIEALGGEYTTARDFSEDKYFQEIVAQSQMMPDISDPSEIKE